MARGKLNKVRRGGGKHFTPSRALQAQEFEKAEEENEEQEEEEEEEEDDEQVASPSSAKKPAAAKDDSSAPIIEVENPNQQSQRNLKASDLDGSDQPRELSRREREALEKERAKAAFWKAQSEGKTDQARADLARLAIIRKQREEAAKKRTEEEAAKAAAKASKGGSLAAQTATIKKALG
ncbi:casein kinase substrate phosphoprotein PP28-domain-containing protein [Cladochytrium replicatum]|nr:casein kinase substrate phosphoprotein PP28-domain-containing protein [Cladochytrium replicatum]